MAVSQTNQDRVVQSPKTRVVILGDGAGGVMTAIRLERLGKPRRDVLSARTFINVSRKEGGL